MSENSIGNISDSTILQQLTAYLDGELDADEIRIVEKRLASEAKYRGLMQQLQKTWDVLDILPAPAASSSFTQSTMKLVVGDAKKLSRRQSRHASTWPLRILALILLPSIAVAGTWFASRYVQSAPNEEFFRDLPVISIVNALNCDQRLSIGFLEQLAAEGDIFDNTRQPGSQLQRVVYSGTIEEMRAEIALASQSEKNRLSVNRDKYQTLDQPTKDRIKQIQTDLAEHSQSQKLMDVLSQYYVWLKSLGESNRAEFLDIQGIDERIARIKQINQQKFYEDFGKAGLTALPQEDAWSIYFALYWLIHASESEIRDALTEYEELLVQAKANEKLENNEITAKQWDIYVGGERLHIINLGGPAEKIDEIVTPHLGALYGILTPNVRQQIDAAINWQGNPGKSEAQLLVSWMLNTFDARFNPANLTDFYETLSSDEKDRLENEHPADRERILIEMYRAKYPR
jgi:hypothetical protein